MNIHCFIQRIFLLIHLLIAPRSIPSITLQQPRHHWDQILASLIIRTVFELLFSIQGSIGRGKLKSFFMISIHLFELTYVRRVKMSFSIMICVYDEYWYVSPREDKASRNSLTSLFVQSRPHSDRDNLKGPRAAYRTVYSIIQSLIVNKILKTNNSLTKRWIRRSRSAKIRVWKYQ